MEKIGQKLETICHPFDNTLERNQTTTTKDEKTENLIRRKSTRSNIERKVCLDFVFILSQLFYSNGIRLAFQEKDHTSQYQAQVQVKDQMI